MNRMLTADDLRPMLIESAREVAPDMKVRHSGPQTTLLSVKGWRVMISMGSHFLRYGSYDPRNPSLALSDPIGLPVSASVAGAISEDIASLLTVGD